MNSMNEEEKKKLMELFDTLDDLPQGQTSRWFLCESWTEHQDRPGYTPYDCACCMAGAESEEAMKEHGTTCGCICHKRIEKIMRVFGSMLQQAEQRGMEKAVRSTGIKDKNGKEIFLGQKVRILYTDWPSQIDYSISLDEYKKSISRYGTIVFNGPSFEVNFGPGRYGEDDYGSLNVGPHGEIEIVESEQLTSETQET